MRTGGPGRRQACPKLHCGGPLQSAEHQVGATVRALGVQGVPKSERKVIQDGTCGVAALVSQEACEKGDSERTQGVRSLLPLPGNPLKSSFGDNAHLFFYFFGLR